MRCLKLLFLLLNCSFQILADCGSGAISVWPAGNTIAKNPVIILTGSLERQSILRGLGKTYIAYLKHKEKNIPLLVNELLVGEYYEMQAVVKPEENLVVGAEYELWIEGGTTITGESEFPVLARWKVEEATDTEKPVWIKKPVEKKESRSHYKETGFGYIHFGFSAKDNSAFVIKATVRSLETNTSSSFYLIPESSVVKIGYGLCFGAFRFRKGNAYDISFDIMDASGNTLVWKGKRKKFVKPPVSSSGDKKE